MQIYHDLTPLNRYSASASVYYKKAFWMYCKAYERDCWLNISVLKCDINS